MPVGVLAVGTQGAYGRQGGLTADETLDPPEGGWRPQRVPPSEELQAI